MSRAAGQTPDEPRVYITKAQLTHLCTLACARYVVKDPLDLGTAEVCVDNQSGLLTNFVDETLSLELVAVLCGTAILPYDSMVDRLLGVDVPDDGGLTLIGNADGGDIQAVDINLSDSLGNHAAWSRARMYFFSLIVLLV